MKKNKIMAMGLAALMALGIGSASADTVIYLKQNPIPAAQVKTVPVTEKLGPKSNNAGRLYVRHYLWSDIAGYYGASHHTNYFQAFNSDRNVRLGGNWMAPDSANFVKSNNIKTKNSYGIAARANTKYADDGFATIRISGYMDSDA